MPFFQFKGSRFYYRDTGKGPALIFLHGFLEHSAMWWEMAEYMPDSWRKIAIDLPGHGQSENLGYVHSMEEMAEVVQNLIRKLRLKKVILCGHSMGGYVALAFAEKYPAAVKGLVLLNSSARADSAQRQASRNQAINLVKRNSKTYIQQSIPLLFSTDNRKRLRAEIQEAQKQARNTSKQGIIAALEGMKNRPDREVLLHFGLFPIFMAAGKNDPVIALEDSLEQINIHRLPHLIVPGGHMSYLEAPELLFPALRQFFRQVISAKTTKHQ